MLTGCILLQLISLMPYCREATLMLQKVFDNNALLLAMFGGFGWIYIC